MCDWMALGEGGGEKNVQLKFGEVQPKGLLLDEGLTRVYAQGPP